MPQKSNYQRLTGRRRRFMGFSQLWLAPDHILLVQNSRFSEQYRRFALADIQAIVVTTLPDRMPWQIVALSASLVWTAALFAVPVMFWKVFFGVTGATAIAVFIADITRGPRCRCHLYTEVSRELLAPVSRVRGARAFLDRIRPAIEGVQGVLAAERIGTLTPGTPPEQAPPEVPAPPGYLPEILFALFLIDALFVLASTRFARAEFSNILPTTFFAEFVILVVALIRRPGRDPRRFIYALMAVAIVCMGWDAVALGRSFVGYMGSVFDDARRGKAAPPTVLAWMGFQHAPAIFAASWRAAAGVIGLAAAFLERRAEGTKR
jgi:hypothetical protein